jgi:SAM-dependent methyltransferase
MTGGGEAEGRIRGWEYAVRGDYHRNLDPNWSYAPTYRRKMYWVRQFLNALPPDHTVLDAGCGEGVLVEEYRARGRQIEGLDLHYESAHVRRGDVLSMPFESGRFDAVLLLDVFEHLAFADQGPALREIHRVLKKGGALLAAIPNLAHLSSRVRFALLGRLERTDSELNHVGERPFRENRRLLGASGFVVVRQTGVTLTIPGLYWVMCRRMARFTWLHDLLEPLAWPSLSLVTMFWCRRAD